MNQIISVEQWFDAQLAKIGLDSAVRNDLLSKVSKVDGAYILATTLPEVYKPTDIATDDPNSPQRIWELTGLFFLNNNRLYDTIAIFDSLYQHMLRYQIETRCRMHKGMPLIYISDAFFRLSYRIHSKRYLMYTLCEDAAGYGPDKRVEGSGVYGRAVWQHGLSDALVTEYTRTVYNKEKKLNEAGWFPERLLAELDDRGMTETPTEIEYGCYRSNPLYVRQLIGQLGSDQGHSLERLAHYLVSMIPGTRVYRRHHTESTDYDVVGSFEGPNLDFRSEIGRYFVCECKDWIIAANFTTFAKFARVIDSVKSRFGILFSKNGISGEGQNKFASREQLKLYADRGIAIVVITQADLEKMGEGENFLSMLRIKYEMVRLDVTKPLSWATDLGQGSVPETDYAHPPPISPPPSLAPLSPPTTSAEAEPAQARQTRGKQGRAAGLMGRGDKRRAKQ